MTGRTLLFSPPTTRRGFFDALATDAAARADLLATLREAPFEAYFWETPPLSPASMDRPAAFALVESPSLARVTADRAPFEQALDADRDPVVAFPNLGRDARLVVPREGAAHLAAFVRTAPDAVAHALLERVGAEVGRWRGPWPLWVSTSGLGVHWLHVRLDRRPKYYAHTPWRSPDA